MRSIAIILGTALWFTVGVPAFVNAQETGAGVAGRVADSTDAVLPGVTITARHVDSGNTFVGVTDASGEFRIGAMRPGNYKITVELPGFATVTLERLELLLGQHAVLDFKMTLSSVRETVTVTGESPLVDVTQSKLGGNIDTRQLHELPVNGRNWMQLTMLAPGSRQNAVDQSVFGNMSGSFQLNLDGQQVSATQTAAGLGQPRFSEDAIGEFELVNSRFDATQGRSRGVQVNVVTKSGTNTYTGTESGYFRSDRFNAEDFIVHRVLPYSDQQFSSTFGGPIAKDKAHFFLYYEGERTPQSDTFTSPYPRFNLPDMQFTQTQNMAGVRVDDQFGASTRLMIRGNGWINHLPLLGAPGATSAPSSLQKEQTQSGQIFGSLTNIIGQRATNEIKVGLSLFHDARQALVPGAPQILLRSYTIGPSYDLIEHQDTYSIRNDFTFTHRGHELKLGGEFLLPRNYMVWPEINANGVIVATNGPVPANIQDLFPVWNDPSTWNLAALSPITTSYQRTFGTLSWSRAKPQTGAWLQDNWQVTPRLTVNLGVRWDFALDGLANDVTLAPVRTPQPQEWRKFGPRTGFAYSLPDKKTVFRGGWGKYFSGIQDTWTHTTLVNVYQVVPTLLNDGRANFAADPYNLAGGGHVPTFAEAQPGVKNLDDVMLGRTPYSYQTSIGLQRQVSETVAVQADYEWIAGRNEETARNVNLSFDPVTGANYPWTDASKRPFPNFGLIGMRLTQVQSNYHALVTAVTKRFSDHFQASATYTLSRYANSFPLPLLPGCAYPMNGQTMTCNTPLPVPVVADLGGEYGLGASGIWSGEDSDQRHRAVFNGIWELPYRFQLSGLYFFGSGQHFITSYGGDLRQAGIVTGYVSRLRPDGTIVPRNTFVGPPLHRVDLRVRRRFPLLGHASVDGMFDVFNVFNHANYGSFVTNQASPLYGQPVQNSNSAYQPLRLQLGFRISF